MSGKRQKYEEKIVALSIQYLNEDDFFLRKRFSWEEWVIARLDIQRAIAKAGKGKKHSAKEIAAILNGGV